MVAAICAVLAPPALARTETTTSGSVTATLRFRGHYPTYSHESLTIAQSGRVVYDRPVDAVLCGGLCAPGSADGGRALSLLDLDQTGQPSVVLDLYSGGAHCCTIAQVFTFSPAAGTYTMAQHNFGDPGYRVADLGHDGNREFLTSDDAFAYAFTDYAASGMPIQVLRFSAGRFVDVTRSYPRLITADAALWMRSFRQMARQHYQDSVGVAAAWAADEDMLGRSRTVTRFLNRQARAGHLNSALGRTVPTGRRFVAALQRFLRRHGYLGG